MKKTVLYLITFTFVLAGILTTNLQAQETAAPRPGASSSQFLNVPQELQTKCDNFFDLLSRNEFKVAFDNLLDNSPFKNKQDQVANLIEQTKQAVVLYGKIKGSEPVSSEVACPSLVRLRYLGIQSNYPMRWIFTFYNSPKSGWIVVNVKLDDMSEYFFSDE